MLHNAKYSKESGSQIEHPKLRETGDKSLPASVPHLCNGRNSTASSHRGIVKINSSMPVKHSDDTGAESHQHAQEEMNNSVCRVGIVCSKQSMALHTE